MTERYDIAVIGGGIAGLSLAAELAGEAEVVVLEAEDQPGYHATGRSAAIFAQSYGNAAIRALTAWAARPYAEMGVLSPRGLLRVASAEQAEALKRLYDEMAGDTSIAWMDVGEIAARVPLFRPGWLVAGFANEDAADMDVARIMAGHGKAVKAAGGRILTGFRAETVQRTGDGWEIGSGDRRVAARLVVDAAGAWADDVAGRAGARPVGLSPRRRSAVAFDAPDGLPLKTMPLVVDAAESFYLKPEGAGLMASPCDETPSPPMDSRPDEIDVAICIDRIERAFDLTVGRPKATWSGLRTFAADRTPVCGWDREVPGFLWLAGQGGYGVQTAPALARIAADMVLGRPVTAMERVDLRQLGPGRFQG